MNKTFSDLQLATIYEKLAIPAIQNPKSKIRNPIHVVYGGADRFSSETPKKFGKIALKTLENYVGNSKTFAKVFGLSEEIAEKVFDKVIEKLKREPVEDFRIDFEDGYGFRSDEEEDSHAISASNELQKICASARLPVSASGLPFCGFRIKSFAPETMKRAIRTLDLFLTNLLTTNGGELPANFVVTLPKVEDEKQVAVLVELLEKFEDAFKLPKNSLKLEILIETPTAIFNNKGEANLRNLVEAANGRCVAAHFGAYDFTSSFGIVAKYQDLNHPLCDFARAMMQVSLAPLGIRLSDSVTTQMPVPLYKGETLAAEQIEANKNAVRNALKIHFDNVTNSLKNGFYQSWDLHPNQLIARYATVYAFFAESFADSVKRLRGFTEKATQAILTGNQFDDAASANGLLNYFARAESSGAVSTEEIETATGLKMEEIRLGNFAKITESQKS